MSAQVQSLPAFCGPAYVRAARVTQALDGQLYRVCPEDLGVGQEILARMAMSLPVGLKAGDRVLVAGENPSSGFIIGLLACEQAQAIHAANGAGAQLQGQGPEQCIRVHDPAGRMVFEYYPESLRSVVTTPQGDLELAAPNGNIALSAGKGLYCRADQAVVVTSQERVQVNVRDKAGQSAQTLRLDNDGAQLKAQCMTMSADKGDVTIGRATYRGRQLTTHIQRAKLVYGQLEITAQRLWERSQDAIHTVANLCQMQAGRMRTLVQGTHHMQSEHTTIIAKEDIRINAEKINLG